MSMTSLLSLALLGATLTVDDDAPANHATIGAAIAAAQSGDLILVEPGTYPPFALTKRLTILGRAGGATPQVTGLTAITMTGGFTVAGLAFQDLTIVGVAGPAILDDCSVGVAAPSQVDPGLLVENCAQLVLSRLHVVPRDECGCPALTLRGSNVALSDATLVGGKGASLFSSGGAGGPGLRVDAGSFVTVSGCPRIEGGYEGWFTSSFGTDGPSGPGLAVKDSVVVVRGGPGDVLLHGDADALFGQTFGSAIVATDSTVAVSGVSFDPNDVALFGSATLLTPPAEPYVEAIGVDPSARVLRVEGPAGATGWIIASLAPGQVPLPGFDSPLWLDVTTAPVVLPIPTLGTGAPVDIPVVVPAGLAGVTLRFHAAFPTVPSAIAPGASVLTNAAALVVRF